MWWRAREGRSHCLDRSNQPKGEPIVSNAVPNSQARTIAG